MGWLATAASWIARKATGAAVIGGGLVATDVAVSNATGNRTITGQFFGGAAEEVASVGARGAAEGQWMGFYAWMQRLGEFIQSITGGEYGGGLSNWARRNQGMPEVNAEGDTTTTTPTVTTEGMGEALLNAQQGDITTSVGNTLSAGALGLSGGFGQILGHGADFVDWGAGNVASWFGVDTGYQERNLSEEWMHGARNLYAENVHAPDLRGGWASAADNIGHGTAYVATALTGAWATGTLGTIWSAVANPVTQAVAVAIPMRRTPTTNPSSPWAQTPG